MQPAYSIFFRLLQPYLHRHLARRVKRGKELAPRLRERFGFAGKARPEGKLIWMHGASVGESLSLLPLIECLRALPSSPAILVTTGTVTSATMMEKRLPEGCIHQFVPLDHPSWVKRFLDHWRPDGVIWVESELWPTLLTQIQSREIPAVLTNMTLSPESGGRWLWFPNWAKRIANTFMLVTSQTEADAERWNKLGGDAKAQQLGNLKFISAPLPCDPEALAVLHGALGNRPLWLMASAHPGEELVARDAHKQLQKKFPDLLTIIVPRHTVRGPEFAALLQGEGFKVALRSRHEKITPATQFYIADTMGEMGLFYRLSQLSVVGGTFVPVGGHNPIEPAQLGSFPLYGPNMFTQQAICDAFETAHASRPVKDATELAQALQQLLEDPVELQRLIAAAKAVCAEQAESAPRIWNALQPWRTAVGI